MTIYDPLGSIHKARRNSSGDIFIDNKMVVESIEAGSVSLQSVSSGYKKLTTYQTKQSVRDSVGAITIALLGLIPGLGGAATIAGIVLSLKGMVSDDVYIEITQYYNPNSYLMYDVTKYYKNSDYTGLLETCEHGPYHLEF